MPLTYRKAPAGALRALKSALPGDVAASIRDKRSVRREALVATGPDLSSAHPVYVLGADEAGDANALASARPVTWRALVHGRTSRAAEVKTRSGAWRVARVAEGAHVDATVEALRWATEQPDIAAEPFEVRLLRVPSLHVHALWLARGALGGSDRFVMIEPCPPWLETRALYTREHFLEGLGNLRAEFRDAHPGEARRPTTRSAPGTKSRRIPDAVRPAPIGGD